MGHIQEYLCLLYTLTLSCSLGIFLEKYDQLCKGSLSENLEKFHSQVTTFSKTACVLSFRAPSEVEKQENVTKSLVSLLLFPMLFCDAACTLCSFFETKPSVSAQQFQCFISPSASSSSSSSSLSCSKLSGS